MIKIILSLLVLSCGALAENIRVQNLRTSHNTTFLTFDRASLQDQPQSDDIRVGRLMGYFDYSWVNDPWIDLDNDGQSRIGSPGHPGNGSLIKNAQVLNLGAGYLLNKNIQIGFELPIERLETENNQTVNTSLDGSSTTGLGDVRILLNYHFLRQNNWAFSVQPTLFLPTGFRRVNDYMALNKTDIGASWGKYGASLKFAVDYIHDFFTFGLNAGVDYHEGSYIESTYKKVNFETTVPVGLGVFVPVNTTWGLNIEGTTIDIQKKHNEYTHPGEVLVGLRYWPTKNITTHITYGTGSLENIGGNDPRFIAGIKLPLMVFEQEKSPTMAPVVPSVVPAVVKSEAKPIIKNDKIEILQNVEFDLGSSQLTEKGKAILDDVVDVLKPAQKQFSTITVEGHTDHRGSAAKNKILSQARSETVKQYLINKGIEAHRLKAVGYGQTRPKYNPKNATKEQIDLNRRVEFLLK